MKNLFGEKRDPELQAREDIRHKKWGRALAYYEKKLQEHERDFGLWNLVGDLHMNNRSKAQAVEAWRRSLEGYSLEGLFENVLGVARKILRRVPDEDDVQLILAEAYLGLEYQADCLAAFRSYLKLCKQRSESDMRSLFKKILDTKIVHDHLLEELGSLYKDSGIDDYELEQRLNEYVTTNRQTPKRPPAAIPAAESDFEEIAPMRPTASYSEESHGLTALDGLDSFREDSFAEYVTPRPARPASDPVRNFDGAFETPAAGDFTEIPAGEGKDHYDLGMVYKEMKLWDAAIAEFEQARRDQSIRVRATLSLAECMQETHDLQGALDLLESERVNSMNSPQEETNIVLQTGVIHELLGNLDQALECFEKIQSDDPTGQADSRIANIKGRLDSGIPE
jgi:tetratricopeptide (TPR) repeat protein